MQMPTRLQAAILPGVLRVQAGNTGRFQKQLLQPEEAGWVRDDSSAFVDPAGRLTKICCL